MANTDRARKLLVRTALTTSATIATLVGAQNFAMLDARQFQSNDAAILESVVLVSPAVTQAQVAENALPAALAVTQAQIAESVALIAPEATQTPVVIEHVAPAITIVRAAPSITILRQAGDVSHAVQVSTTNTTQPVQAAVAPARTVIQPPSPSVLAAPAPVIVPAPASAAPAPIIIRQAAPQSSRSSR